MGPPAARAGPGLLERRTRHEIRPSTFTHGRAADEEGHVGRPLLVRRAVAVVVEDANPLGHAAAPLVSPVRGARGATARVTAPSAAKRSRERAWSRSRGASSPRRSPRPGLERDLGALAADVIHHLREARPLVLEPSLQRSRARAEPPRDGGKGEGRAR